MHPASRKPCVGQGLTGEIKNFGWFGKVLKYSRGAGGSRWGRKCVDLSAEAATSCLDTDRVWTKPKYVFLKMFFNAMQKWEGGARVRTRRHYRDISRLLILNKMFT